MKKFIYAATLVGVLGLISACTESSKSSGGGSNSGATLVGSWLPKLFVAGPENSISYTDHNKAAEGSGGYVIYEILNDGSVEFVHQGTHKKDGSQETNQIVVSMGRLDNVQSSESVFHLNEQLVREMAKEGELSEEEIKEAISTPCTFKINASEELEITCPNKKNKTESWVIVLVKIDAKKKMEIQSKTGEAMTVVANERASLAKSLGGKAFKFVKKVSKTIGKDGKSSEYVEDEDRIASKAEEEGTGKDFRIFGKKVSFSEDFQKALVNDKHNLQVELRAGHDKSFVRVDITNRVEGNSWQSVIDGRIKLTDEGFELHNDVESGGYRTQTVETFKLVKEEAQ